MTREQLAQQYPLAVGRKTDSLAVRSSLIARGLELVGEIMPEPFPINGEELLSDAENAIIRGNYNLGITLATRALQVDRLPTSLESWAYVLRAFAHGREGRRDDSIRDYTKALEITPHRAGAYAERGLQWQFKGEPDLALADFERALSLDSALADVYYNRGLIWEQRGELLKAFRDTKRAAELKRNHEPFQRRVADLEYRIIKSK